MKSTHTHFEDFVLEIAQRFQSPEVKVESFRTAVLTTPTSKGNIYRETPL